MKIEIQGYWGARIKSMEGAEQLAPEEFLKKRSHIVICEIIIDGEVRGQVIWDGIYLNVIHAKQLPFEVKEVKSE